MIIFQTNILAVAPFILGTILGKFNVIGALEDGEITWNYLLKFWEIKNHFLQPHHSPGFLIFLVPSGKLT